VSAAQKTTIDWLRFRTQAEVREGLEALRPLYGEYGRALRLEHLDRGKDGFQQACAVQIANMPVGRVDFGGDSQRGWVRWNITGKGCEWVKDWEAVEGLESLSGAEIRRADIALTTWAGEVSHEAVEAAHGAGLFCAGGRPPDMQTILNSNPRAGRTCYVGKRDSDKFFRGYEKGLELAAKLGPLADTCTHIDGFKVEDIYRCEVELKAESRVIPWEVISRRDQYFAGCYPFLAELLPDVGCDILVRRPERAPQTELLAALANCRVQYGATLFTALAAYHGDIFKVWDQIRGEQHNASLLAAGVLLVDHD
jgi:phage replication initiation protein